MKILFISQRRWKAFVLIFIALFLTSSFVITKKGYFYQAMSQEKQDMLVKQKYTAEKNLDEVRMKLNLAKKELRLAEKEFMPLEREAKIIEEQRSVFEKQVISLNTRRTELARIFTTAHPDIIAIDEEIAYLESKIEDLPNLSEEYAFLNEKVEEVRSQVTLAQKEYDDAEKILREINRLTGYVEIAKEGEISEKPAGIDKTRYYIFAVIISLFGAFIGAVGIEIFDKKIYTSAEAEKILKAHVAAVIPRLPPLSTLEITAPYEDIKKKLIINFPRKSLPTRSYEVLYNNLRLHGEKYAKGSKKILLTSCEGRDGTTLIASNLALCAAKNGEKVVLVDANLRYPALCKIFNLSENLAGLTDVLTGAKTAREAVRNITDLLVSGGLKFDADKLEGLDNLKILLSGSKVNNAATIFARSDFSALMRDLASDSDLVIIDSAPVGVSPETLDIMKAVGSAFLIVKRAKSKYPDASNAIRKMEGLNAPLAGLILNG